MVFAILKTGFLHMWANKRIVLIFYLASLFFGFAFMLPVRGMLSSFVGESLISSQLAGPLNIDVLTEFLVSNRGFSSMTAGMIPFLFTLYGLTGLFLSGGAFAIFDLETTYTAKRFWGNSAYFFGRFLRLFLYSIPLLLLFLIIPIGLNGLQKLIFGADPSEYITYWGKWARIGLRYLGLVIYFLILDYARIITVFRDEQNMRAAIAGGIRFVFSNFRRTFTLIFAFWLIGVIALLIYNSVSDLFSASNAGFVILMILVQQLFMFFRMTLKLALWGGEVSFYKALATSSELEKSDTKKDDAIPYDV